MTNPSDEKEPRDEEGAQAEKPDDEQDLSKETLADLDATEEDEEAAKGGYRSAGCMT